MTCKILFFSISIFLILNADGQGFSDHEISKSVSDLANSDFVNINEADGRFSWSLNLHNIETSLGAIPISINYSTIGNIVQQDAGPVGLGWNINCMWKVDREMIGLPDEYVKENRHPLHREVAGYWRNSADVGSIHTIHQKHELSRGYIDTKNDFFSVSGYGLAGKFAFAQTSSPGRHTEGPSQGMFFPAQNTNVELLASYTDITLDDGIDDNSDYGTSPGWQYKKMEIDGFQFVNHTNGVIYDYAYESGQSTYTNNEDGCDPNGPGNCRYSWRSEWSLQEVNDANGNEILRCEYANLPNYTTEHQSLTAFGKHTPHHPSQGHINYRTTSSSTIEKIHSNPMEKLHFRGGYLEFVYSNDRSDIGGAYQLDEILVYQDNASDPVKRIVFTYSYFGSDSSSPVSKLRLDSVQIFERHDSTEPYVYHFDYNEANHLSHQNGRYEDLWGFENSYNDDLIDRQERQPEFDRTLKTTLKNITFPNGSAVEIEYEQHEFYHDISNPWDIPELEPFLNILTFE